MVGIDRCSYEAFEVINYERYLFFFFLYDVPRNRLLDTVRGCQDSWPSSRSLKMKQSLRFLPFCGAQAGETLGAGMPVDHI